MATKEYKLEMLAQDAGISLDELLHRTLADSVSPGICMSQGCDFITNVEPDQEEGWCENCDRGTVMSVGRLAGVV